MTDPIDEPSIDEVLRAAFGNARVERCGPLQGGFSGAQVLKITVAGRHYVLRQIRGEPPMHDPRRQLACMALASDRGIAPRLHYANPDTGVSISEFIEGVMLGGWIL